MEQNMKIFNKIFHVIERYINEREELEEKCEPVIILPNVKYNNIGYETIETDIQMIEKRIQAMFLLVSTTKNKNLAMKIIIENEITFFNLANKDYEALYKYYFTIKRQLDKKYTNKSNLIKLHKSCHTKLIYLKNLLYLLEDIIEILKTEYTKLVMINLPGTIINGKNRCYPNIGNDIDNMIISYINHDLYRRKYFW
jgi:hypothetical protein